MTTERGLGIKTDISTRKVESSDFPNLCEGCLGENPYVRMQKIPFGGTCKMCDRPYTMFKWRPGRGEGYKKTEVCQTCSRLKNICQTCILDLQFGLPSQLRDAVLAEVGDGTAIPESDVGKEYQAQKQLMMLENGENPWNGQLNPNEMLLEVARSAISERDQVRVKIPFKQKRTLEDAFSAKELEVAEKAAKQAENEEKALIIGEDFSLPPGVGSASDLGKFSEKLPDFLRMNGNNVIDEVTTPSAINNHEPKKTAPPRPPPGPPPAWAFKKDGSNVAKVGSQ